MSRSRRAFRYAATAMLFLPAFVGVSAAAFAQEAQTVTAAKLSDVLETPAQISVHALTSMQLSLASAGKRLVSVGERGIVLLSDDNGATWRQAKSFPSSVSLTDVVFAGAKEGVAVGHSGGVYRTTDGGETWTGVLDGRKAAKLALARAEQLKAAGSADADRLLKDAGYLVDDGPDKPFLCVAFSSPQVGYAVGAYGLAFQTRDGGATWAPMIDRIPNTGGRHLYDVAFSGASVWIAGEQGSVFYSADGGQTFKKIDSPYPGTYFGVIPLGQTALLYGLRGNVWSVNGGGGGWAQTPLDQAISVTAGLRAKNGDILLGDQAGRLLRSGDGGKSFSEVKGVRLPSITALIETADGGLIATGPAGPKRIAPETLRAGRDQ